MSGSIADLRSDEAGRAARRRLSAGVHACTLSCGGLRLVRSRSAAVSHAGKKGQDFADGALPGGGFRQRQVRLDLVAVAAAVFLLHHVAGLGEVGDDAVGGALGDAQARRDVAQPRARVVRDAQQHPGVGSQETPVRHARKLAQLVSGNTLPASGSIWVNISRNLLLVFWNQRNVACRHRGPAVAGGQAA